MPAKMTYICDRCGLSSHRMEGMQYVSIVVSDGKYLGYGVAYPEKQVFWCEGCRQEFQIGRIDRKKPEAPIPPTIEDLIHTIIQKEIQEHENA